MLNYGLSAKTTGLKYHKTEYIAEFLSTKVITKHYKQTLLLKQQLKIISKFKSIKD